MKTNSYRSYVSGMLPDIIGGIMLGFFILHPVAMMITGMPSNAPMEERSPSVLAHFILNPMSLYFTLLGLFVGILTGHFRSTLRKQNALLKNTVSERDSLLRVLSHDLNNSMCAALGYADLLGNTNGDICKTKEFRCISSALNHATAIMAMAKNIVALQAD